MEEFNKWLIQSILVSHHVSQAALITKETKLHEMKSQEINRICPITGNSGYSQGLFRYMIIAPTVTGSGTNPIAIAKVGITPRFRTALKCSNQRSV